MTKTPEELTEEWKAGKLNDGEKYFIRYKNSIFIATFRYFKARINYWRFIDNGIEYCDDSEEDLIEVLAPCNYDEYKAMEQKCKIWSELAENLLCLEEEKWENLVKNGTKEQQLDFLRHKEKYSLLAILDKYDKLKKELESARWYQTVQNEDIGKLRGLLKECLAHLSLGEIGTSVTPINTLIDRINAAIGESEER